MYIVAVGSRDAPLRVTLTDDPQGLQETMQVRRTDQVMLYHQAHVAEQVAATTLEYVHALLSDWKIERKTDYFDVSPDDAKTIIERGIVACAQPGQPPTEKRSRPRTDVPMKVAQSLQALADREGVPMSALAREAVNLLYASRGIAAPIKEKS